MMKQRNNKRWNLSPILFLSSFLSIIMRTSAGNKIQKAFDSEYIIQNNAIEPCQMKKTNMGVPMKGDDRILFDKVSDLAKDESFSDKASLVYCQVDLLIGKTFTTMTSDGKCVKLDFFPEGIAGVGSSCHGPFEALSSFDHFSGNVATYSGKRDGTITVVEDSSLSANELVVIQYAEMIFEATLKVPSCLLNPSRVRSASISEPTTSPTNEVTSSVNPSLEPTSSPTLVPSSSVFPSLIPTSSPTLVPSSSVFPSLKPTSSPSISKEPSTEPTFQPSLVASTKPSKTLSASPSVLSSEKPSSVPSHSVSPTTSPSVHSSLSPTEFLSSVPSSVPSKSVSPSTFPSTSLLPSTAPSVPPSNVPSTSVSPTTDPSTLPSSTPSISMSPSVSLSPSLLPSASPSSSNSPSTVDSSNPSLEPSQTPSIQLSSNPSVEASNNPSVSSSPTIVVSSTPTMRPTKSSSPSISPTINIPEWCVDNPDSFLVRLSSGNKRTRDCAWVAEQENRCMLEGASDECPRICGTCLCKNNPGSFSIAKGDKTCSWVEESLIRCYIYSGAFKNCPQICGRCPSAMPSTAPSRHTTESPSQAPSMLKVIIPVSATIKLHMSSTSSDLMSFDNKKLLQDTVDALLSQSDANLTYDGIETTVENEIVRKISTQLIERRQLQSGNKYIIIFDLATTASLTAYGRSRTVDDDAQFKTILQNYFLNPINSDTLITALTDNTSPSADYFRNVDSILFSYINPDLVGAPIEGNEQQSIWEFWKNTTSLIIVASVACGLLLIVLLLAMFLVNRGRRRRRYNEVNDIEALREDPEDQTPVNVEATARKDVNQTFFNQTTFHKVNQSFIDMQPVQPYAQQQDDGSMDDEYTDAATFRTLENIYSGEDQISYGYSLDDALKSKRSHSPNSEQKSYQTEERSYDPENFDISLGSPGSASLYSNLTRDDYTTGTKDDYSYILPDEPERKQHLYERVCLAPSGKLGIVIDTTKDGPVVYQVKEGSPLVGLIYPGDKIIAIDEINTRGMTASNITKIMARKADKERKITLANVRSFKDL